VSLLYKHTGEIEPLLLSLKISFKDHDRLAKKSKKRQEKQAPESSAKKPESESSQKIRSSPFPGLCFSLPYSW